MQTPEEMNSLLAKINLFQTDMTTLLAQEDNNAESLKQLIALSKELSVSISLSLTNLAEILSGTEHTQLVNSLNKQFTLAIDSLSQNTNSLKKTTKEVETTTSNTLEEITETTALISDELKKLQSVFDGSFSADLKDTLGTLSTRLYKAGLVLFVSISIVGGVLGYLTAYTFTSKGIVEKGLNDSAELRQDLILLHKYNIKTGIFQDSSGQKYIKIKGVRAIGAPIRNSQGNYSLPIEM